MYQLRRQQIMGFFLPYLVEGVILIPSDPSPVCILSSHSDLGVGGRIRSCVLTLQMLSLTLELYLSA